MTLGSAVLVVMLGFALATAACDAPAASTDDRAVLEALYHATDGANWTNDRNWLTNAPISAWHGVTADRSGRVTELRLRENALRGEIPSELSGSRS